MGQNLAQRLGLLAHGRIAGLGLLLDPLEALGDVIGVGDEQLELELLEVALRIASRREPVRDGQQRVDLTQAAEERGPRAGDVLHPDRGGCELLRADERRDPVEPVVGDRGHADVGLVRLRGVGGDLGARLRQRVEQRRLARVGEPHDADLERHGGEG